MTDCQLKKDRVFQQKRLQRNIIHEKKSGQLKGSLKKIKLKRSSFLTKLFCAVAMGCCRLGMQAAAAPAADAAVAHHDLSGKRDILIAYFTWAENTTAFDPATIDVDATTSASLLSPGNTALLASWLQEETGGDLFSITVREPYSSDYETCLDRAADERDHGRHPAINPGPQHFADYEIIFLGFPNWWYSCPMAVEAFIMQHDFSGKTVIPFCAHGTGGFARSLIDIAKLLPEDAQLLEAFGVYRPEVKSCRSRLLDWVRALDY